MPSGTGGETTFSASCGSKHAPNSILCWCSVSGEWTHSGSTLMAALAKYSSSSLLPFRKVRLSLSVVRLGVAQFPEFPLSSWMLSPFLPPPVEVLRCPQTGQAAPHSTLNSPNTHLKLYILGRPKWTRPKYELFWRLEMGLNLEVLRPEVDTL